MASIMNRGCGVVGSMPAVLCGVVCAALLIGHASAQALGGDTEWATIGAVGNKGYDLEQPFGQPQTIGRGAVNYEYRIATHEVTTGQWIEFMNAVNGQDERGVTIFRPSIWGGRENLSYNGPGEQLELNPVLGPDAARIPVGGISWRTAARYVNWLHNGKQKNAASLAAGAYDTSTFGENGRAFTDQAAHSEGAKFWIPTFDELFKAVYYDPDKLNDDGSIGGWWTSPHGSDTAPVAGLPQDGGETSGGLEIFPGLLPVGSYTQTTPWGLFDASGSVGEMTESIWDNMFSPSEKRLTNGSSFWDNPSNAERWDSGDFFGTMGWSGTPFVGLRIASVVPAPGSGIVVGGVLLLVSRRRNG